MSNRTMGQQLAREIFEYGSDMGRPATRIQFKAGKWPNNETDLGGLCEDALAAVIDCWIAKRQNTPPEDE